MFAQTSLTVCQVCEICLKRGKTSKECWPIWHQNKSVVSVRCPYCMDQKQGCSFRMVDWDISAVPTLMTTSKGRARRAREARKKQGALSLVAEGPDVVKGEPSGSTQESISSVATRSRARTAVREGLIAPAPSSSRVSGLIPTSSANPPSLSGKTYPVFLESIKLYENTRLTEGRTTVDLDNQIVELQGIIDREQGELRALQKMINSRARIMEGLIDDLDREIAIAKEISTSEEEGNEEGGEEEGDEEDQEEGDDRDFVDE